MDNRQVKRNAFKKIIQRLIEMKYITVNDLVTLDAVAGIFVDDLRVMEEREKKRKEIEIMFTIMQRYTPDLYEKVIKEKLT